MLIKNVLRKPRKGTVVTYTHEEAAPFAVERGVKSLNTKEKIYWVLRKSIQTKITGASSDAKKGYSATAEGTALIGYTDVATDEFYAPKLHNVKVDYKSSKDARGLPDIEVVNFEALPQSNNPRDLALFKRKPAPTPKVEEKKEAPKVEVKVEVKKEEPKKEEAKKEEPKKEEAK
jgi:hypothetical protein